MPGSVYTIGHSTHALEKLIGLLQQHHVNALADVRSKPYSRMNPQFNRETLKSSLREAGIAYVFLGKELGARSDNRECYCNGRVQYDLLAKTEEFQRGIRRVKEGAKTHRIALMCAEKDPLHCHRTILVSRHLVQDGLEVRHILANGRTEEHHEAIVRLARILKLQDDDMFRSKDELEDIAYRLQGQAIAYQESTDEHSQSAAHI
jgi:uncharacterized protein (DUF488 family)